MASTESERTPGTTAETERPRKATTRPESRRGMSRGAIRAERRARSEGRKRRKRMLWYVLAVVLSAAFIASLLVPGGLRSAARNRVTSPINTGGPVPIQPDDGRQHLVAGEHWSGKYSTRPATSGPHWQTVPTSAAPDGAPARWGAYDHVLPDEVLIHNLEHGGIGLHYNCPDGCPELAKQLTGIAGPNPALLIVSPYPNMDHKIAITSWRHVLYLDEFDEAKVRAFVDAYQDRAPESAPQNQF